MMLFPPEALAKFSLQLKIPVLRKRFTTHLVDSPIHLTETSGEAQKCNTTTVRLGSNTLAYSVGVVLA